MNQNIRQFQRTQGIKEAVKRIKELCVSQDAPVLVAIGGGSGSGKTTAVTSPLKRYFAYQAVVVSMDRYYRDTSAVKEPLQYINTDTPDSVDLALFIGDLVALKKSLPVKVPIYEYRTRTRLPGSDVMYPAPVIFAEGLFVLRKEIAKIADLRIFVEASTATRRARKLRRDKKMMGNSISQIRDYFDQVVEPMQAAYVEPTKMNADIIINNDSYARKK